MGLDTLDFSAPFQQQRFVPQADPVAEALDKIAERRMQREHLAAQAEQQRLAREQSQQQFNERQSLYERDFGERQNVNRFNQDKFAEEEARRKHAEDVTWLGNVDAPNWRKHAGGAERQIASIRARGGTVNELPDEGPPPPSTLAAPPTTVLSEPTIGSSLPPARPSLGTPSLAVPSLPAMPPPAAVPAPAPQSKRYEVIAPNGTRSVIDPEAAGREADANKAAQVAGLEDLLKDAPTHEIAKAIQGQIFAVKAGIPKLAENAVAYSGQNAANVRANINFSGLLNQAATAAGAASNTEYNQGATEWEKRHNANKTLESSEQLASSMAGLDSIVSNNDPRKGKILTELVYNMAHSADPGGRVTDKDFENWAKAGPAWRDKVRGWFQSGAQGQAPDMSIAQIKELYALHRQVQVRRGTTSLSDFYTKFIDGNQGEPHYRKAVADFSSMAERLGVDPQAAVAAATSRQQKNAAIFAPSTFTRVTAPGQAGVPPQLRRQTYPVTVPALPTASAGAAPAPASINIMKLP